MAGSDLIPYESTDSWKAKVGLSGYHESVGNICSVSLENYLTTTLSSSRELTVHTKRSINVQSIPKGLSMLCAFFTQLFFLVSITPRIDKPLENLADVVLLLVPS